MVKKKRGVRDNSRMVGFNLNKKTSVIFSSPQSYRDLSLVCRDGLACAVAALNELLGRWTRLADTSRVQFVYIIGEMIRGGIVGVDSVVWNLLRYAAGGDVSPRNILLVTSLLDIFQDNK